MLDSKTVCQSCRGCCKFRNDETYFAPIFNKQELEVIKNNGDYIDSFKPYKESGNVFQINLIENEGKDCFYSCPYLDDETHLCKIYNSRPLDCKIWPLIIMKNQENNKAILAYSKSACELTGEMDMKMLDRNIKRLEQWFDEENFIESYRKYPDLIWNHEPETIFIKELDLQMN